MKKSLWFLTAFIWMTAAYSPGLAAEPNLPREIQALKERIEELEQKLEEQESLAKRQAAKSEAKMEEKIGTALEERFGTLEVHGGAILYYQGSRTDELEGVRADSPSGAGFSADLALTWHPALPVAQDGELFTRIHAGFGEGADRTGGGRPRPADVLLANLNTIADDNTDKDGELQLLEVHYTHRFFQERLSITGGKGEQLGFLDDNAFANDEGAQFVGKPFVNNTVLDSENEYTPLIGVKFQPVELIGLSLVGASTSRPLVEDTPLAGDSKSNYDNVFSTPFVGAQLTLSPKFGELEGNYRLAVTENMAFTPDLQYVWNPGGDSDNDGVFAGMVRAEFGF